MKKIFLILTLVFISLNKLEAKKIKIAGYYINLSKDTVRVIFLVPIDFFSKEPNFQAICRRIKYYDTKNQKLKLDAEKAEQFSFKVNGQRVVMLSRNYDDRINGDRQIFLRLIKNGKLKLLRYYTTGGGYSGMGMGGGSYSIQKDMLEKANGKLFEPSWLSFKKDMTNYLSDCPSVAKKIEEKTYRSADIEQIVEEYNKYCN